MFTNLTNFVHYFALYHAKIIVLSCAKVATSKGYDVDSIRRDIVTDGGDGGDGMQYVYKIYETILNYVQEYGLEGVDTMTPAACFGKFLDKQRTIRKLSKRVLIRRDDSAKVEYIDTTVRRECYTVFWEEFRKSPNSCNNSRYNYLEDIAIVDGMPWEEAIYRRLPQGVLPHIDNNTESTDTTISALNLTDAQGRILELRLQGYGQTAIASYLGISLAGVQKHLRLIGNKYNKTFNK